MKSFDGENINELLQICQVHQYFPPSKFCAVRHKPSYTGNLAYIAII